MIDEFLALLFPETCKTCHARGTALCASCTARIPAALPIPDNDHAIALFEYGNHTVRQAIWELKYHHHSGVAKALVRNSRDTIIEYLESRGTSPVVLVPVPQHYKKTLSRGFNQSNVIARWIQRIVPETSVIPLLKKYRATIPQAHTTTRQQRMRNVFDTMEVSRRFHIDPDALYIIVDDVITTGSTIEEASRALRAAGAKHIGAIAIAHGYADKSALTFKSS